MLRDTQETESLNTHKGGAHGDKPLPSIMDGHAMVADHSPWGRHVSGAWREPYWWPLSLMVALTRGLHLAPWSPQSRC